MKSIGKIAMVIMALAFNMQAMAFGKADAQAIVSKFYSCLKIIAEENYTSDAPTNNSKNAYNEALELCFDTDINMPNDFNDFGFSGGFSGNDWFLQVGTYLKRLREFAIEKKNVRYTTTNIKEVRALEEIKHRNTENSTNFYAIFVDKTISVDELSQNYVDTVMVNVDSGGKIVKVTNNVSGIGGGESIIQLRAKAAELFANGQYQEAYDVYLQIVMRDPMQGDPFYRLALMGFQNKGCKNRFRNRAARMKQAFKYLEEAKKHGTPEIRRNAQNVEYDMTNGFV